MNATKLEHLPRAAQLLVRFTRFSQIREGCMHRQGEQCIHPESNGAICAWESCLAQLRRSKEWEFFGPLVAH